MYKNHTEFEEDGNYSTCMARGTIHLWVFPVLSSQLVPWVQFLLVHFSGEEFVTDSFMSEHFLGALEMQWQYSARETHFIVL